MVYADVVALPALRYLAPALPGYRIWGMAQGRQTLEFDRSQSVEDIAGELLPLILERQPEGPVTLAGHSFGGILAYEMARQLEGAGRQVQLLALLDVSAPRPAPAPALEAASAATAPRAGRAGASTAD